MRRRALLAGVAAGLGGCLGGDGPADGSTPATATGTAAGTPTDRATATGSRTETPTPPPSLAVSPHPGDCPVPRDEGATWVVCADAAPADAPMTMTGSADRVGLPGSLRFTLTNGTDATFETNFYDWALYKRDRGRWHYLVPRVVPMPMARLAPGDAHAWAVSFDGRLGPGVLDPPKGERDLTVHAVGGGRYAFLLGGWFEGTDGRVAFGTTFGLDGPQLDLVPTDLVEDVEVNGDVLRARWTAMAGDGGTPRRTYVLERADVRNPRPVVAEQLAYASDPHLDLPVRDAFALLTGNGVSRVEVAGRMEPLEGQAHPRGYAYRGETYRADLVTP